MSKIPALGPTSRGLARGQIREQRQRAVEERDRESLSDEEDERERRRGRRRHETTTDEPEGWSDEDDEDEDDDDDWDDDDDEDDDWDDDDDDRPSRLQVRSHRASLAGATRGPPARSLPGPARMKVPASSAARTAARPIWWCGWSASCGPVVLVVSTVKHTHHHDIEFDVPARTAGGTARPGERSARGQRPRLVPRACRQP